MKNTIRQTVLAKRKALSADNIKQKSEVICQKVIQHPVYQGAELIFAYIDAKNEVETKKIIEYAWENDKKVAVPKVHGDIMKFYLVTSYDDLEPGNFGILEPKERCEEVQASIENSIVIMPGVVFDTKGNRIGYGKGYYDKYFSKYPDIYKIAIAFDLQIVPEILADRFDIRADEVITEE